MDVRRKAVAHDFAARLIAWQARHGRHDLPWQQARTPYRVWLSEVMLQQTQVATVIPYFERFVATYPDVFALARAGQDEVLHLWTGLGYYSRARNLHRAAQLVVLQHGGEFPRDVGALAALPGIGPSTAAAILALTHDLPHAILDGNVKRVLARYHAIEGWPGERAVLDQLWQLARAHLPSDRVREYTQALMDLGATLCKRTRPMCSSCPLVDDCAAHAAGCQHALPAARPRRARPARTTHFIVLRDAARYLLERRPASGVWGGLWSLPEITDEAELAARVALLGFREARITARLAPIAHGFTHFDLSIQPLLVEARADGVRDSADLCWYSPRDSTRIGLPAPVARLLRALAKCSEEPPCPAP